MVGCWDGELVGWCDAWPAMQSVAHRLAVESKSRAELFRSIVTFSRGRRPEFA
jgi:hypothetical protein